MIHYLTVTGLSIAISKWIRKSVLLKMNNHIGNGLK